LNDTPAASLSQQSTISILPDDVLREIFKSYLDESPRFRWFSWCTLAQVCQRWRHVIVASPRYLDLQIVCTTSRPVRHLMSGWPALPIAILHTGDPKSKPGVESVDNIIAALEHNNRVFDIKLSDVLSWQLERFVAAMQKPFPELTSLDIGAEDKERYFCRRMPPPVFPDSFLAGSAPRLQSLRLDGIPFPGLLKLLLSSRDLVDLHLWDIPSSVYFTPEEIAICLSPMKHLQTLKIKFYAMYSPSLAAGQHPPSHTHIVLPALTSLQVYCTSEFLESLVSRLDAPSLEKMEIRFPRSNEPVSNSSELPRFISRIEKLETFDQADIHIHYSQDIQFVFSSRTSPIASAELSFIRKW
jgi:F-box-like